MSEHSAASLEAARWLLDIKAVNFRPEEPYTFTAGWATSLYRLPLGDFLYRGEAADH